MLKRVESSVEKIMPEMIGISKKMYENPELGYEEFLACEMLVNSMVEHGFDVETPYCNIKTAFKASYKGKKDGATIAYLAEYDALPGIGHGCGHNNIAAVSAASAVALKEFVDEFGGSVVLIGTPAEETDGSKVVMGEMGAFNKIDVAMIAHPSNKTQKSGASNALKALRFEFFGKTAHAAGSPDEGINALHACISLFNNISSLREHFRSDARVHGVIKDGGKAANIVPDYSMAEFYVRSSDMKYQAELVEKIENCAKAAALSNGAKLEISQFESEYFSMMTNETLSNLFTTKLEEVGVTNIKPAEFSFGSTDVGNVSQYCPTIHPYFSIKEDGNLTGHSVEFANCSISDYANKQMTKTVTAFTLTAIDILKNSEILEDIKNEFNSKHK